MKLSLRLKAEKGCRGYQTERNAGLRTDISTGNFFDSCLCVLNTWVTEITSLAVKDDGDDDTAYRNTYGMLQTCKRHVCVFKHSSRCFLCRCILCPSDAGDYGNTLYLLYGIHPLTRKREVDYARFLDFDGSLH